MENWKPNAIKAIRAASETISEEAEKMIGGYDKQVGDIVIEIRLQQDMAVPIITVKHELAPNHIEGRY